MEEILRSPLEVASLSPYRTGFVYIPGGVRRISEPSTVPEFLLLDVFVGRYIF